MAELITKNRTELQTSSPSSEWKNLCNLYAQSLMSVRDAQQVNSPTINELRKIDFNELRKIFVVLLKRTIKYFGINPEEDPSVSNEQIIDLFSSFCRKHFHWTLADLVMCFNRVKDNPNIYGRFYGRVDASVVTAWFSRYEEEMQNVIENIANREAHTPSPDDVTEDVYMDSLLAKAAGGDDIASKQYHYALETRRMVSKSNGLLAVYLYNRMHRYDEEQNENVWERKRRW